MTGDNLAALVISVLIAAYLFIALLFPEKL
jgi:K+-transporting ATPase KdpF subunit